MLKEKMYRLLSIVTALVLIVICSEAVLADEVKPTRVLKVAFPDSPGISETYELSLIHI